MIQSTRIYFARDSVACRRHEALIRASHCGNASKPFIGLSARSFDTAAPLYARYYIGLNHFCSAKNIALITILRVESHVQISQQI